MASAEYERVLEGKYPGKLHAQRTVERMLQSGADINGLLYFESTKIQMQIDNDFPQHFRQSRFFYYLSGCNLSDCALAYDMKAARSILFIPPTVSAEVIWSGLPTSLDEALKQYDVDEVRYTTQVDAYLLEFARANPDAAIHTIDCQDSGRVDKSMFQRRDGQCAKQAIEQCRAVKDEYEIAMIRKANWITCLGFSAVMGRIKQAKNESDIEAAFRERCITHGARETAYPPIIAAGSAAATLHYEANSQPLQGKLNLLIDAGCEWQNYASDITRTYPLAGKFTPESRTIYDIVLKMTVDTTKQLKAGVVYDDLHVQAHKIAIDGLLAAGILQGDRDSILAARTSTAFFPHGLGHHLGMDCHDTGGNQDRNDKDALFPLLRLRGKVPAGAVVTIEPGIYFCEYIIRPFLADPVHSKYINSQVLDRYWQVGGIRLENNILVTETGHENLTVLPMDADEVEALCC